ncbi:hypothetical protein QQP08_003347 [Theobroma cacao]|nr:hypothetical protein QQP08_003347 [Theobroma cacao]
MFEFIMTQGQARESSCSTLRQWANQLSGEQLLCLPGGQATNVPPAWSPGNSILIFFSDLNNVSNLPTGKDGKRFCNTVTQQSQ